MFILWMKNNGNKIKQIVQAKLSSYQVEEMGFKLILQN